jgi:hypothetical protein
LRGNTCIHTVVRKKTKSIGYKYKDQTRRIQMDSCPTIIAEKPKGEKETSNPILQDLPATPRRSSSPETAAVPVDGAEEDLQQAPIVPKGHLAMKLFEPSLL